MARRFAGAALAAALLLLTGCAASPAPAATPTPATTPTSTPTPTVEPVVVPTIPFDGDCTQVLTAEQLNELLGEGWMTRAERLVSDGIVDRPDVRSIGTLGGLKCEWFPASETGESVPVSRLSVTLMAPDAVPASWVRGYSALACEVVYDWSTCRVGATVAGTWVMAAADFVVESTGDLAESGLDAVSENVAGSVVSRAADRQPDWWTLPDCESLGEEMRLQELLGEGFISGYWEGEPSPDQRMLSEAGVEQLCPWFTNTAQSPEAEFHITDLLIAAGAAWNWDEIAATSAAEEVAITGAEDAVFISYPPNGEGTLYATDGVNVLVSRGTLDFATQMAERALAALAD